MRIGGSIDRLDLAGDQSVGRVTDYKPEKTAASRNDRGWSTLGDVGGDGYLWGMPR